LILGNNIRLAIRDLAHNWSSVVFEQAMQMQALQKVMAKKEDPTTQKTFISVLRSVIASGAVGPSNLLLANGKILDLFWERLTESMQEIVAEKLRNQPAVAVAVYPHLRRAAVELVENLQLLSAKETAADAGLFDIALLQAHASGNSLSPHTVADGTCYEGEFGSLYWNSSSMFESLGLGRRLKPRAANMIGAGARVSRGNQHASSHTDTSSEPGDASSGLVASFKPFRDRFLVSALNRMNDPIIRMFPEVEGYIGEPKSTLFRYPAVSLSIHIGAPPSKRDLQTLTKAITLELTSVALDGDSGLMKALCKECVSKSIALFLSKIESSISSHPETRRIQPLTGAQAAVVSQNSVPQTTILGAMGSGGSSGGGVGTFSRNAYQEINVQLMMLLFHLREAVEKFPAQIGKAIQEQQNHAHINNSASGNVDLEFGYKNHSVAAQQVVSKLHQMCTLLRYSVVLVIILDGGRDPINR
jgi:hypothetical protein